jgi:hypothetical protein
MIETFPDYLHLERHERGANLHLESDTYSLLARTALAVVQDIPHFMTIYRLPDARGCCLDIFASAKCLSIQIDVKYNHLALFLSEDLDSPNAPLCILSVSNCQQDWHRLKQMAKAQLSH